MKYLLDTNIIIDHIRGKVPINKNVIKEGAAISIIVLSELYYGAHKSINPKKSFSVIENLLQSMDLQTENLSEEIVYEFGEIKASLERKGEKVEDFDLLIAATVKVSKLTLVTNNKKHFERIKGLKLYF